MWYVVSGRNGQVWIQSAQCYSKRDALVGAYAAVKSGHDWVEVYQHEEGSFAMF